MTRPDASARDQVLKARPSTVFYQMIRYHKVGGLHFLHLGKFGISWFWRRACRNS